GSPERVRPYVGDFNGDGIHDVLMGARLNDDIATNAGAVYVLYGTSSFSRTYLLNGDGVSVTLLGKATLDYLGRALASAGDVNADGFDDIVVGAYQNNDGPGANNAGAVYILYGNPNLSATIQMNGAGVDVTVLGKAATDRLGVSVGGAGDVNGDGFDDISMAADQNNDGPGANNAGAIYILYGSASLSADYRLDGAGVNVTVLGKAALDQLGFATGGRNVPLVATAGDVNRDGFDDLMMGAPYNNDGGSDDEGAAYVLFGGSSLSATIRLDGEGVNLTLIGTTTNDFLGSVSGAGDVNNDGFDDLIVGAGYSDELTLDAGMAYIIYGRSSFPNATLDTQTAQQDLSIAGKAASDRFGESVSAAGDLNDDGIYDVMMAGLGNGDNGAASGAAFLLYGSPSLSSSYRLNGAGVDVTFQGKAANSYFASSVSGIGDVNNDGIPDFIFGEGYNDDLGVDAGQVYIIFGSESLSSTITMNGAGPDVTIRAKAANDRLGAAVGGGRANPGP
ncbi:MAG: integrin alpha, partial [Deltaproteobacteria bacterium]